MMTTNLLPPSFQEHLKKQELLRLVYIVWILAFSFLLSLGLLLVALRLSAQKESGIFGLWRSDLPQYAQQEQALQELDRANTQIEEVALWYTRQHSVSDILNKISSAAPPGITLDSFGYTAQTKAQEKAVVSVRGTANTRDGLIAFRDLLKQQGSFEHFSFPASNLVKSQDVKFFFEFAVKNK